MVGGSIMKEMTTNFGKLDKFEGHNFRRWQKKMHFLLTTLKNVESAKELWDSLESKYMAEDASSKKFFVSNFNNYKMVDSRPVMEQFNGLLRTIGQYTQHGLKMDELITVSSVIDNHLRIEESLRAQESDKGKGKEVAGPSVNMTEEGRKNKNNKHNKGKKRAFKENNGGSGSNKKPKLECWKCGKTGHFKRDCHSGNKKNNANASDRCWFKTYELVKDGSVLYMGDNHFAPVHGKRSVVLEFRYGKSITLFNVLYVPKLQVELRQNDLIKTLRTDRGGEYYDPVFFQSVGIIHETTAPYTPQQNGVAEKKNRALKKMVNSMLSYSGLSEGFQREVRAVVRLQDPKSKSLGEKGIDCIFVGYDKHSKAYRFYVIEPNEFVSINSIIESRDAILDENCFSSIPRLNDIIPNLDESQRDDHSNDVPSETLKPRRGKRARKVLRRILEPIMKLCDLEILLSEKKQLMMRKMKVDGTINKFKARLVIQSFRQKERIDYFDTYAPVARITTIRLLLALAAIHNLVIHQMDVKTIFLNGDLEEKVYMKQPEEFVMPVNKLSRFTSNPSRRHWHTITRVFKYLKVTMNYDLSYVGYPSILKAYSDASWINHVENSSFTSGWEFLLRGGAISWASNKQTCITGSTIESEFIALVGAGKEAEWLRTLIHEILIWPKTMSSISIHVIVLPHWLKIIVRYIMASLDT
nr:hypothetical protein [Tanacetum cinerariifolium]